MTFGSDKQDCNITITFPPNPHQARAEALAKSPKDKPAHNSTCHPDPALWKTAIIGIPSIGGLLLLLLSALAAYAFFSRRRRNQTRITQNQGIPL